MKKKALLIQLQNQFEMTFQALREINITLQKLMDKETTKILEKQLVEPKPDSFKQPTEAENKAQVLFMREEWETRKADAIKKARDEREATKEREKARCLLYNEGVLESTDKSNEQNKAMNEFEDTSEPEPYIQKEQSKEEIDAEILAVQKEIDMKLQKIFEKARKR